MAEKLDKLPTALQIDNAIMKPAELLTSIWWVSMVISDARDKRRGQWRRPTLPKFISFDVPPDFAPIEISYYLHGRGIQTATHSLQWIVIDGRIGLHKVILVPGRLYEWATVCLDRLFAGDPVPQRGPMVQGSNIDMVLSDALFGIVGGDKLKDGILSKRVPEAEKQLKGPGLRQRLARALED